MVAYSHREVFAMFETLFSRPAAVKRHFSAPLAAERVAYLRSLADQRTPISTIRRSAFTCRWIACRIQKWPKDYQFTEKDIDSLALSWARRRATNRRRAILKPSPKESFRSVTRAFLRSLGRLAPQVKPKVSPYENLVQEFLEMQLQERGLSRNTCGFRCRQARRFLSYLHEQGCHLEDVVPTQIDSYIQALADTWSRVSLRSAAVALRAWLRFCERKGYVRSSIASAILVPRVYRLEGLPAGPTWEQICRIISDLEGSKPTHLRARSIFLLLAVYGLRASEICSFRLEDINWRQERIRIVRLKNGKQDMYPLDPIVGNALARYLRDGRPQSKSRALFLSLMAPYRPMSYGALAHTVRSRLTRVVPSGIGCGPHAIRHACAQHLLDAGLTFKEIGDHLGHRSVEATRIYTKVDLKALRLVVLDDLGGIV